MARRAGGIVMLRACCLVFLWGSLSARAQDDDKTYTLYGDGGIGFYGSFGKSDSNDNADGGTDLTYNHLFAEFERGADTANASGTNNGHTCFPPMGCCFIAALDTGVTAVERTTRNLSPRLTSSTNYGQPQRCFMSASRCGQTFSI